MSERYKAFIRELKARLLETDTTPAAVCYGFEQAKQTIDWYMGGAKQ